ncbi:Ig-like domain-containing protein [Stenotrophomonas sp. NPDC087984]
MATPTVTLVTASPNPAVSGQSVTLTATVIPLGTGTPTGTVTFVVSGGPTLTGTLSGGTASVTASGLSGGTHIVTATYNGDANFTSSTGTTAVLVIPASTTTTVTSAPDPSTLGQPVTFTATVTPVAPGAGIPPGDGTPTGLVTFILTNGVDTITTISTVDANGFAFLERALTAGNWDVSAVYEGDANFGASGVSEYIQVVTEPDSGTVTATMS